MEGEKINGIPRIGSRFPEVEVDTTHGRIKLPNYYKGKWFILFSHPTHFIWEYTWSTDNPINSTPNSLNFGYILANSTNSVVHTGVKSAGWLNNLKNWE